MSLSTHTSGCGEFQQLSRRSFLFPGRTSAALAAAALAMPRVVKGAGAGNTRDVLIYVFLRGGMDGLSACVPHGDGDYYAQRPDLAIPPPGQSGGVSDLDGFFGLAPALEPLLPIYQAGDLAFVQASGSPDPSRSHFEAMRLIESGIPLQGGFLGSGWLGRAMQQIPPQGAALRGAVFMNQMSQTLTGAPGTLPLKNPDNFDLTGFNSTEAQRRAALESMYQHTAESIVSGAGLDTLATVDLLSAIDFDGYVPDNGATYPDTNFGKALRHGAAMIKADIGVEVMEADLDGWDHHEYQGGQFAGLADELAQSLHALWQDLGSLMNQVTVVVHSEFGRRVDENGSNGTDHGRAGLMTLIGGHVAGGQVHGQWPGLSNADLDDGALVVTTDYRDIVGEVLHDRLGVTDFSSIFPNYTPAFQGVTN